MQAGKYFNYDLAKWHERLCGTIIEGIIITLGLVLIFGEANVLVDDYSFESILAYTILYAILGAIFYPVWSGNIGHKIMGLKVISAIDGSDQKYWKTGALREGLKNIYAVVIFPVLWLLWDENRQNLYDKTMKTYVVKNKRA